MATPRELGMELLQDFADKLARQARQDLGVSEIKAKAFAQEAAGRLADDWGGQSVYIPMDMVGRRSTRNAQIYREFTGDNQAELALKHGLSTQCIYRIVKVQRELRMPRQGSLLALSDRSDPA